MDRTVLVTGGAGYIGSHTALALIDASDHVVIVDNLVNSSPASVAAVARLSGATVEFVEADLTDRGLTAAVFDAYAIDAVIHFAGLKAVGESTELPLLYYRNNLISTLNVLDEMAGHGVFRFVFSSSATVYGDPETLPIPEGAATAPTNAYGRTKLMIEDMCRDASAADERWHISLLRYFNPVGAHESGEVGEDPNGIPNNLVPFVMQVAVGRREQLRIFGGDYDTPDGTGVRDYIHVMDLAAGHVAALDHLAPGCREYNLGTGTGASVLDIVGAAEKASGQPIPYEIVERRTGDIAVSLADPSRANAELHWRAERDLEDMLADAWRWQSKHPDGFPRTGG